MKLISASECRATLHHYSTKALAVLGGLQGAWMLIDPSIKADLPPGVGRAIAVVTFTVAILGLLGKFIDQTPSGALPPPAPPLSDQDPPP